MNSAPEACTLLELCSIGATEIIELEHKEYPLGLICAYMYGLDKDGKICHHIYQKGDTLAFEHLFFLELSISGVNKTEDIKKAIIEHFGDDWNFVEN